MNDLPRVAVVIFFSLAALTSHAITLVPGDLVVAGRVLGTGPGGGPTSQGQLLLYDANGTLKGTLDTRQDEYFPQLASVPGGATLYAAVGNPFILESFDAAGNASQFPAYAGGGLVVTRANTILAFSALAGDLTTLSLSGSVLNSHVGFPDGPRRVDLGLDQCTVYEAGHLGSLQAVDACHGTVLPSIPVSGFTSVTGDVRALTDGTLLVTGVPAVTQITPSGTTVRTHSFAAGPIAFTVDSQSVWALVSTNTIRRYVLATDAMTATLTPPLTVVDSIAVIGEPRGGLFSPTVPSLSPVMLLLLALSLALIASWRMTA